MNKIYKVLITLLILLSLIDTVSAWQIDYNENNLNGIRTWGTTYYNNNSQPRLVDITFSVASNADNIHFRLDFEYDFYVANTLIYQYQEDNEDVSSIVLQTYKHINFFVPSNSTYWIFQNYNNYGTFSLQSWYEWNTTDISITSQSASQSGFMADAYNIIGGMSPRSGLIGITANIADLFLLPPLVYLVVVGIFITLVLLIGKKLRKR